MSASKWIPYPNYKSSKSPVGTLPTSWDEIRFGMLFETQKGKIPSEIHSEPIPDSIPYVSMEYLREGTMSQYVIPEQGSIIIEHDDLMILWDGSNAGEILKSKFGILSSTAAKISPKNDECRDFDFFSLKSMEPIIKSGNTGMGIPHVGGDFLKELILPRPSLDEKQKIAKFLNHQTEAFDSAITLLNQKLLILEEKRSALITRAVTKGLNPGAPMKDSDIDWIGDTPEYWNIRKIRNISRVVRGQTPRPGGDPRFFNGQHMPWITVAEVTKDSDMELTYTRTYLTEEGVEHSIIFEEGTFLLTNSGATLGVPKILAIKGCMNDGVAALLDISSEVSKEFLYYFFSMMTETLREQMKGSGQPNLNTTIIGELPIPIPPLEEQNDIVNEVKEIVQSINHSIRLIANQVKLLKEYRTSLISSVVTGKIDLRSM